MKKIYTYLTHEELCNILMIGTDIPIAGSELFWDNIRKTWVIETELDVAEPAVKEKP